MKSSQKTQLLRDWAIVNVPEEDPLTIDELSLYKAIVSHTFDALETLNLPCELVDNTISAQIGKSPSSKDFQLLPLTARLCDVTALFGVYIKFFIGDESECSGVTVSSSTTQRDAFQVGPL